MSVVFGPDAFTVGANIGIAAYDATDYAYVLGSGTAATVNAANGRVQQTVTTDTMVRVKSPAVPTTGVGIISMLQSSSAANDTNANPCCRMKTDNTANCYVAYMDRAGGLITLYRCDGGSFVSLTALARSLAASHTVTFQAVTNGSQVDLTLTASGLANVTFSDTNAQRKLDGTFGFHMFATTANVAWLDDLSVDDAAAAISLTPTIGAATLAGIAAAVVQGRILNPGTMTKI